ncbi:MAG: hypothetical protein HYU88_14240 [Chloroflexi bacterium]|nr:hypothetical protein [Chloroflexota bacterium]
MSAGPNGREALEELSWRAEILQAMYWMHGEGLADEVRPAALADFLATDSDTVARHMRQLAADGYLEAVASLGEPAVARSHYRLTPLGLAEGGRSFRDEFADLTRPAHGACAPGCWCDDPSHAGEPCPSHPEGARA